MINRLARFLLTISGLTLLVLTLPSLVEAFGSSSTTYKLEGEFGIFGGAKNSASYRLTDTGGGFAVGFSNSTDYVACSGFQCTLAQVPTITFSLNTNSVSLGTLTSSSVNTQTSTATVTTNLGGYNLTVVQNGPLTYSSATIAPVSPSPGTISAGTEAYGLATSKASQDIVQDTACSSAPYNATALTTSPQTVASSTAPTGLSGDTTTLCYGATKSGSTPAGNYNQVITLIATGTF